MSVRLSLLIAAALAARAAHADPPLPAAQRAMVEKRGAISKAIYIAPNGKTPARWIVFAGDGAAPAQTAWMVTPTYPAGRDVTEVGDWPVAVKVIDAVAMPLPAAIPDGDQPFLMVIVESLAASEIGQPAGLRAILPIDVGDVNSTTSSVHVYPSDIPAWSGVATAADVAPRMQIAAAAWSEHATKAWDAVKPSLAKIETSDRILGTMMPKGGIAVYETWQGVFGRQLGVLTKLDKSPATRALRDHLDDVAGCSYPPDCGSLTIGVEADRYVIRAVRVDRSRALAPAGSAERRAVPSNTAPTQTMATARLLGVAGKLRGEAPLTAANPAATIGIVGDTVIVRDGAYASASTTTRTGGGTGGDVRFADFDGDGLTDVLVFTSGDARFVLAPATQFGDPTALLEMTTIGATSADAAAAAALAVPDQPITVKQACAVLAAGRTAKGAAAILAPGGEVFGYEEPGQPGRVPHETFDAATVARAVSGKCQVTSCEDKRALCTSDMDGPSENYYQFVKIGKAWKLLHAAYYTGS